MWNKFSLAGTGHPRLEWGRTGALHGSAGRKPLLHKTLGTRHRSPRREREVFLMTVTAARTERSAPIIQTLPLYRTGAA